MCSTSYPTARRVRSWSTRLACATGSRRSRRTRTCGSTSSKRRWPGSRLYQATLPLGPRRGVWRSNEDRLIAEALDNLPSDVEPNDLGAGAHVLVRLDIARCLVGLDDELDEVEVVFEDDVAL